MLGLHPVDLAVVCIYFVGIAWIGLRSARNISTSAEYFMPRRFGKWMLTMSTFSTGTSAEQAVTVASKCYSTGASGIWYQWQYLFTTPFYWVVAPILRRFRAVTAADIFEARYDRSVALLFCAAGLLKTVFTLGLMLKGTSALLTATTGGAVKGPELIIVLTVIFVSYSFFGGWSASVVTNVVQGVLTIVFSFMLVPFVWMHVGGIAGMKQALADTPKMFSLVTPDGISFFSIAMLTLGSLVSLVTIPHNLGVTSSSTHEEEGQFGFTAGAFLKRICTAAWCITGIAGAAYFVNSPIDPDAVYGSLAQQFLPGLLPGLLGIFVAATLAEVMGTCSSMMNSAGALATHNLYRHFLPEKSDAHYLKVGRISSVVVVVAGVAFALWLPNVVKGLEVVLAIAPIMGVAFWLGIFWRGTTTGGAWAATLAGFVAWFACERLGIKLGSQLAWILGTATVFGVVVSLFTRRVPEEKLHRFAALVQTPVRPGEVIEAPCTLPANVTAVVDGWRFPVNRRGWVGFGICWAIVVLMILALWLILQIR